MTPAGLPHSETLGSKFGYQLPEAYRRFLRPSSVPGAKASTVCPYKLDTQRFIRCSRPLCSSQRTISPTDHDNTFVTHRPEDHHPQRHAHQYHYQQTPPREVWAFKTQQHAPDRLSPDSLARSNRGSSPPRRTNTNKSRSALLPNVPPMSCMQHACGADHASSATTLLLRSCSLERR